MADCGASGSALDRAARAVIGASSDNGQQGLADAAAKHAGSFLGHATLGASLRQQAPMPAAPPDQLLMPGPRLTMDATAPASSAALQSIRPPSTIARGDHMDAVWNQQSSLAMATPHPVVHGAGINHSIHQQPHPMQMSAALHHHHLQYQQQQQQQLMMHQFMMVQQQQHLQQQLQHNSLQRKQHLTATPQNEQKQISSRASDKIGSSETSRVGVDDGEVQESLDTWHSGLEEELENAIRNGEGFGEQGHEGTVKGASIEELAAAWAEAQEEYAGLDGDLEPTANLWAGADDLVDPFTAHPPQYEFTHKTLPSVDDSNKHDWMEEGMRLFREGNLKEAIRSFEMELQLGDPDNSIAWRMLGRCHAENDQDREAIACLEQAVERDPYDNKALLALGVSYVNELDHDRALTNLKLWITHNPKYAGLELGEDVYGAATGSTEESESQFDEVQRLLLRALEYDSTDAADIWEALGVVYNVSRDYDAAINAFRKAMETRPEDYQLWNKLGATLANSNQSDKALPAYHKALELKPKYARAWLNMAISHSNLQDFHEAARCYLQTLSLNPSAVHCWSYLRVALSCSENYDLLPFVASQDLSKFREHFDFVMYDDNKAVS